MLDLSEDRIDVGGRTFVVLRPANAEALIDEDAFTQDEFLPYWAEVWPSGIALARYVSGLDVAGKRVLELGCGLALPSLAAAAAGADVLATDWSADALELVRRNADANHVRLRTALVRWDAAIAVEPDQFDLVLAADLLYEARNVEPLLALLPSLIRPRGVVVIADPGRQQALHALAEARARGWEIETVAMPEIPRGGIYRLTSNVV